MDVTELVRHAAFLRGLAHGLLGDEHLAEEAVQEAYVAAVRARSVRKPRAWLAAATRNLARKTFWRETRRREAERAAARRVGLPSAAELAGQAEAQRRVAQAVLELDEPYRTAVLLRYFHEHTPAEIARRSGEPLATVKTRLRRALRMLRARLDADHGGDRAKWGVALLPLARHGPGPLPPMLGGLAMKKTVAAAVVVAALVTLLATHASRRGAETGPAARAVRPAPGARIAREHAPVARADLPDRPADREALVEAVAATEWQLYREAREISRITAGARAIVKDKERLLAELGLGEPEEAAAPQPATQAYLQDLVREYRGLAEGAERLDTLLTFVAAHARYLEETRDLSFLAFLEEVIRASAVTKERVAAVPEGGGLGVADLLLRLADHEDDAVRAAVAGSLARVEGDERPRAVALVLAALDDASSLVRWTAAVAIEHWIGDPGHTGALVDRLSGETHPIVMDAMVRAVLALDPDDGAGRVETALRDAPREVRALAAAAMRPAATPERRPPSGLGFAESMKRAPTAPERKPDDTARAHLERLAREYRALAAGAARRKAVESFARIHAKYLDETGDDSFLPLLSEVASSSPDEEERVAAVRSLGSTTDPRAVDALIALAESPDAALRGAVAGSLAWVRGAEVERAHERLVAMADDASPRVRRIVAHLIGSPLGDPAHVPLLLAGLQAETDPSAAYAMVQAILRLDPREGRKRIGALRETPVITQLMRFHDARAAK